MRSREQRKNRITRGSGCRRESSEHFGDREGALEAAARGLLLEPGDYEFLTLKKEIEAGEPLERMEYHWINPGADQALQQGRDEDAENKTEIHFLYYCKSGGTGAFLGKYSARSQSSTFPTRPIPNFPIR